MMEKFDPNKFKTIKNIPDKLQKNFAQVSESGSFVRREAHENDEWEQEKADKTNKSEATQPSSNTKIETIDLIHEKALEEHRKIEEKYTKEIGGLEKKLGIGLSDDSKKKIYSQISAEHQDETMSAQEKGDRHDEQEIYNNEQILAKSKEIMDMPEETLMQLPEEKRREMITNLKWNRFADRFGSDEMPEETLEAESKIYKTYKPSAELQAIHAEQADALLETISKDFAKLNEQWNAASVNKRLEICQAWADQLSGGYKIPRVRLYLSDHISGDTVAAFQESTDSSEPSSVAFSEGKLEQGNMRNFLYNIRHEMSHAFQCAARNGHQSEERMNILANDIEWLRLTEERDDIRDNEAFKKSHERYLSLPDEQDAHLGDKYFSKKIEDVFSQAQDKVLGEAGLEELETIRLNGGVARWARRIMGNDKNFDGSELVEVAKKELTGEGPSLIEGIFLGKKYNECLQIITQFEEKEEKANEILKKRN